MSFNKPILIGISILITTAIPSIAFAEVAGVIEPDIWHIDTKVTINGTNLRGPVPSQSKVCFAPVANSSQLLCFSAGHSNIDTWTSGQIIFTPPKNAPPIGQVILLHPSQKVDCQLLFRAQTCVTKTVKEREVIGNYIAHPFISSITEKGSTAPVEYLEVGKTYVITGYRFGDTTAGMYVGNRMINFTDINSWSYDSIEFTPLKDYVRYLLPHETPELRVFNGAAKSNEWLLSRTRTAQTIKTRTRGTIVIGSVIDLASSSSSQISSSSSEESSTSSTPHSPFRDITDDDPYLPAIVWGVESGFLQGYPDPSDPTGERRIFRPTKSITRAEFLKIMLAGDDRLEQLAAQTSRPFSDMDPKAWYAPYIRLAVAVGVVSGYPDKTIRPNNPINVAEAMKLIYGFFQVRTQGSPSTVWYARYLEHAKANTVLFDEHISPGENMSRQDVVWVVWRLLQLKLQARG